MAEKRIFVESEYKGDKISTCMPIPTCVSDEKVVADFVHKVQVALVFAVEDISPFLGDDESENLCALIYRFCEYFDE